MYTVYQFCALVTEHQVQRYMKDFPNVIPPVVKADTPGPKFTRIVFHDGGRHSRYFVRNEDGAIFACEGWKKPNLRRQFGTLETIMQFDWGGYEGRALPDSDYEMISTSGPYATAKLKKTEK